MVDVFEKPLLRRSRLPRTSDVVSVGSRECRDLAAEAVVEEVAELRVADTDRPEEVAAEELEADLREDVELPQAAG